MAKDRGTLACIDGLELAELERTGGKLYYYERLSAGELNLFLKSRTGDDEIDPDAWPRIISEVARDENGAKLFPAAHIAKIREWDAVEYMKVIQGLEALMLRFADALEAINAKKDSSPPTTS